MLFLSELRDVLAEVLPFAFDLRELLEVFVGELGLLLGQFVLGCLE